MLTFRLSPSDQAQPFRWPFPPHERDDDFPPDKVLHCSFCKKFQHEVWKLIAGPDVFICDECVDLCNDIVWDEGLEAAKEDPNLLAGYIQSHGNTTRKMVDRTVEATRLLADIVAPPPHTKH
ncbi:hypothetical protein HPS43_03115 [Achromobacter xylosoxidans]|nr:hypothetical protein HPS43_03115 [Achromobacter xylosoxidans]